MFVLPFKCLCVIILIIPIVSANLKNNGSFPKDILFGTATAAYQFEGAWNVDGKGENIWDNFTHQNPSPINNNDTGDVACNTYYRYKEDVRLAAELGVQMYRFSVSWTRVLPTGYTDQINQKGLNYYKKLVREIRKYGMIPVATIYHWDLPQRFFDDGIDWTTTDLIPHFVNYSRIVITNLPEVGFWLTVNEPYHVCRNGYGTGEFAPGVESDGFLEYQCTYVIIKAHAAVYHMYVDEFPHYTAKMSLAIDCQWTEPLTNSIEDQASADRQIQFECGMYLHPIYKGGWPAIVEERIENRSTLANFTKSRLPKFTPEEIAYINGTYDFLGLNHYSTKLATDAEEGPFNETSYSHDMGVDDTFDPSWIIESNGIMAIVPYGIFKLLLWLKDQFGDIDILITEVGMSDNGTSLYDNDRVDFIHDYFCYILEAMYEGVNIIGITIWSLIDDFEWSAGYSAHFGLYHINFTDPSLTRRPKLSVGFVQKLMETRKLSCYKPNRHWPGPVQLPRRHHHKPHHPHPRPHSNEDTR